MAHYAHEHNITLSAANEHFGYLSKEEFEVTVDPYAMTKGGILGK